MRAALILLSLLIAGCAVRPTTPVFPSLNILVLGDSFASDQTWPRSLERHLGPGTRCEVHAVAGATTADLTRWVNRVGTVDTIDFKRFDYMIVQAGVNDSVTVAESVNNLKYIMWVAKQLNPRIRNVLIEYPDWRGYPTWTSRRAQNLGSVYDQVSGDGYVDLFVSVASTGLFGPELQTDGLHFNEQGKQKLASTVAHAIVRYQLNRSR